MAANVVLESFSEKSTAYKLGYILLGYSFVLLFLPLKDGGESATYLVTLAITGAFIGAFLVFLKPLKYISHKLYSRDYKKTHQKEIPAYLYYSPYLNESKGEIYGGILFSLTCLLALFNTNFNLLSDTTAWIIRIGLMIFGLAIFILTFRRYNRLKKRFPVLELYYTQVESRIYQGKSEITNDLRLALNRKDWEAAFSIMRKYNERKRDFEPSVKFA